MSLLASFSAVPFAVPQKRYNTASRVSRRPLRCQGSAGSSDTPADMVSVRSLFRLAHPPRVASSLSASVSVVFCVCKYSSPPAYLVESLPVLQTTYEWKGMQCAYRQQVFQSQMPRPFALILQCISLPRLTHSWHNNNYFVCAPPPFHITSYRLVSSRKRYTPQGSGGKPVVLIHGFGVSSFQYRDTLEALSLTNKVYALDLLGFGSSGTLLNVLCLVLTLEILKASPDAKTFSLIIPINLCFF